MKDFEFKFHKGALHLFGDDARMDDYEHAVLYSEEEEMTSHGVDVGTVVDEAETLAAALEEDEYLEFDDVQGDYDLKISQSFMGMSNPVDCPNFEVTAYSEQYGEITVKIAPSEEMNYLYQDLKHFNDRYEELEEETLAKEFLRRYYLR